MTRHKMLTREDTVLEKINNTHTVVWNLDTGKLWKKTQNMHIDTNCDAGWRASLGTDVKVPVKMYLEFYSRWFGVRTAIVPKSNK